jgi:DNA ligase-1
MPSPTKKRKLNNGTQSAVPTRGLEYFFSKQRQSGSAASKTPEAQDKNETTRDAPENLTDEELARKLQAEWDQEVANERQANQTGTRSTPSEHNGSGSRDESPAVSELKPPKALPTMPKPSASGDPKKPTLGLQSAGMAEDTVSTSIPLDESPLTFEPSKYIPQLKEHWASEGGNASYALLTRCFVLISGTTSRIKIVDTLVNCLRVLIEGDPTSLLPAVSSNNPL